MAFSIASDLMIFSGGAVTAGSLLLAAQHAASGNSNLPPPSPYEDIEYPAEGPVIDLLPYYVAGFVGAVVFGAGVMLKFRGRNLVTVPVG